MDEVETALWERMPLDQYVTRLRRLLADYTLNWREMLQPESQRPWPQQVIDLLFLLRPTRENIAAVSTRVQRNADFARAWNDRPDSFPRRAWGRLRRQFADARRRLGPFEGTIERVQ